MDEGIFAYRYLSVADVACFQIWVMRDVEASLLTSCNSLPIILAVGVLERTKEVSEVHSAKHDILGVIIVWIKIHNLKNTLSIRFLSKAS